MQRNNEQENDTVTDFYSNGNIQEKQEGILSALNLRVVCTKLIDLGGYNTRDFYSYTIPAQSVWETSI